MNEDVAVRITGDASGAVGASKASATAVAEASALMKSKLAEIQLAAREAFGGMGNSAIAGAVKVGEASTMVEMAAERMATGASLVRTQWAMVGASFSKLNGIMLGITAALAGGALFKGAIDSSNKLASENLKLSRALGITLEKASGVHAAMHKLGIETDTVVTASQKMVRQLKAHEDSFNKIGIATRDANGHFRDTLDIMTTGLGKLGEYRAGVDRTALAQLMFGRGAGDVTQLMRLNNQEIAEGARVAKELGLVTTNDGVTAMRAYKASVAEVSEIFEAFKVRVGSEVLPLLTQLSDWLREHGASAVKFFASQMVGLATAFLDVVRSGQLLFAWMQQFVVHLNALDERVESFKQQIRVQFQTIGKVIRDAFALDWGAIEADWNAGMAKIDQIATAHAKHIAEEMGAAKRAVDLANMALSAVGKPARLGGGHGRQDANKFGDPDTVDGLRADDIKMGKGSGGASKGGSKAKGAGSAGPSLLSEWNAELDKALAAEKNWGVDELAFTLKFWEDKLALHRAKSKEQLELENKINKLKLAAHKQELQEELKDDKQKAAMAEESARTEVALAQEVLQSKLDIINREEQAGTISHTRAAQARADLNRQIYQLDIDLERKLYDAKRAELLAERGLYREKTKEFNEYTRQILLLEKQHLDRMVIMNQQAQRKIGTDQAAIVSASRQRYQGMANMFGSALSRMATMQQSFGATVKQVYQGMVSVVAQAIEQMIAKWIMAKLVKLGLVKAEAASTIPTLAAQAGAGGVASMAAAPWPLDMTAPAFGAAMSAAALAFAPGITAMGGWDVPGGAGAGVDGRGGRSAIIHPREMVLPADLADQVRGGGGGGGGNHLHLHGQIIHNPSQLKRWFEANSHAVGAGVRQFVRKGGNTSPNR